MKNLAHTAFLGISTLFYLWISIKSGLSFYSQNLNLISLILFGYGLLGLFAVVKQKLWLTQLTIVLSGFLTFSFATQLGLTTLNGVNFGLATTVSIIVFISSLLELRSRSHRWLQTVKTGHTRRRVTIESLLYLAVYYLSTLWFLAYHKNDTLYGPLSPWFRPVWPVLFLTFAVLVLFQYFTTPKKKHSLLERYDWGLNALVGSAILMLLVFLSSIRS